MLGLFMAVLASSVQSQQVPFRVEPSPYFSIQSASGEAVRFSAAVGATLLSPDSMAIADGPDGMVRIFDRSGRQTHSIGRQGDGPGEFSELSSLRRCGPDTLVVTELLSRRVTVLTVQGTFVRRITDLRPLTLTCNSEGRLAFLREAGEPPPGPERIRDAMSSLELADLTGGNRHTLALTPAMEVVLAEGIWWPRPFGRVTTLAMEQDRAYVGTGESRVDVFSLSGQRLTALQVPRRRRTPSSRQVEHEIARLAAPVPQVLRQNMAAKIWALPRPDRLPDYRGIWTGPNGTLWIQVSFPGEGTTVFEVLDRHGRPLGSLQVRLDLEVYEIGEDYLLAAYEGEDGESVVGAFRLLPR